MATLRSRWALGLALLGALVVGQSAAFAHTVKGHIDCSIPGRVPYGTLVTAHEVDPVPGGMYDVDATPLGTATVDEKGDFTITFAWTTSGSGFEMGDPDMIFLFTQNIGGSIETIYTELPTEAHWNVGDGETLEFETSSELAACMNPDVDLAAIPTDKLFLFTRVGNHETAKIDCKGSASGSQGYHQPCTAPHPCKGPGTDQPFGRTLDLFAWFGKLANIDYYKVKYSADSGATWTDIGTSLPNKWYDTSDSNPLNWHFVPESMGPSSFAGVDNLYEIPYFVKPDTPWTWLDRIARFDTTHTADGLVRLKVEGYKKAGSSLTLVTSSDLLVDPNYGEIVLQVDNSPPTVAILDVKVNGTSTEACNILSFGVSAGDTIGVDFRAWDARGHLGSYSVNAMYGHNCSASPQPGSARADYDGAAATSPLWQGGSSLTTEYKGDVYAPGVSPPTSCNSKEMPTCAYQFRLNVSKRTTDGYGLVYEAVEDTWHTTVQRP